jgi:hypothetical protein
MYVLPAYRSMPLAYGQDGSDPYGGSTQASAAPTPPPAPAQAASIPITPTEPVSDLSSTMVLRGAVGVLAGAAVAPRGYEAIWAAAGFVAGATLGEVGIVGLLAAALWKKAGE